MTIAIVGSTNIDLAIRVPHICEKNETVIGSGSYEIFGGGKGANQAAAVAAAGGKASFISKVGVDAFGEQSMKGLIDAGVDCSHVIRDNNSATGLAAILVDQNGDNAIAVAPGANEALTIDDINAAESVIADASHLVVQLEVPFDTVRHAMKLAAKHGTAVIFNPAPAPAANEEFGPVTYFTPNEVEAAALAGIPAEDENSLDKISAIFFDRGVENVIITLGARGCFVRSAKERIFIDPYRVDAVDTTGAGDTFNGFLAAALSRGEALGQAAKYACAAAALSVTRHGARTNLPTHDEVTDFMGRN
ncbi:ribokinase [Hyphococcus formosus]|uniref:ribokinase n=1 Tax=Hyphococcus formosus TaxID=3143534 RepID=UPI00398AF6B9